VLDYQVLSALLDTYRGALGKPVRTFHLGGRLFDFVAYWCFYDTYVQGR